MELTKKENQMLSGEKGPLIQEAMRFLVALGSAYDAEKMVDISFANIILGSSFWGKGTLTRELVEEAVNQGLKVKVPTTFNNWGVWDPETPETIWDDMDVPGHVKERVQWENELATQMGIIPTCTCAPYLNCDIGTFPKGAYISTIESSAIVYYNSVLGVRANRDCVASFFAAITGKYPECGVFLDKNRYGDIHFDVQTDMKDIQDFGLLGIFAGKIAGKQIPVFTNLHRPKTESLMELSAALASSGATTMFHIVGVTPEAPDFQSAFGGKSPKKKVVVTESNLAHTYQKLSQQSGTVDFICLGCPHYSVHEIAEVAQLLENKQIHERVTLWVCTSPATAVFARIVGYTQKIREAGGIIMSGPNFCPLFGPGKPSPEYTFSHPNYSIGNIATDSSKQAFYAKPNLRAKKVFLGSREKCIKAAITAKWEG